MKFLVFRLLLFILISTTLFSQKYSVFYYEIRDADYFHLNSRLETYMQKVSDEDIQLIDEKVKPIGSDVLKTFSFESVLRIDGNRSSYYPLKTFDNDSTEAYVEYGSAKLAYISRESVNRKYSRVFMDLDESKKVSSEFNYGKNYLIEDYQNSFDWEITNERKKLLNYNCKKAITLLDEGIPIKYSAAYAPDYEPLLTEVWYTEDIPVKMGPIGLWGLPGLVLEVKNRDIHIIVKEITTSLEDTKIEPPTNGEIISRSDYEDIPIMMFNQH